MFLIISIAFITLFERHLLGLRQVRLGPQKSRLIGVFQPIFDGLKLFKKDCIRPILSYGLFFILMPFMSFILIVLDWVILPF